MPPRPGDEHGEAHLSEYSLIFEVALLRRGLHDWQTIDVGFGLITEFTEYPELFCFVLFGHTIKGVPAARGAFDLQPHVNSTENPT
jgi:hypothetical protein